MPIKLPDVTLIAIDAVAHDLTKLALDDTLKEISPAQLYIFSNQREIFGDLARFCVKTPDFSTINAVGQYLWYEVPAFIETSHVLIIQYDGWVLNSSLWKPEFLEYDYIGAPWPWHHQMGNGGFSLRSKRLMAFLVENRDWMPHAIPEDDTICRKYRGKLEEEGFRFAPIALAEQFAFEREKPRLSFGFHGLFHYPMLDERRFAERVAAANDYVRSKTEWKEIQSAVHEYSNQADRSAWGRARNDTDHRAVAARGARCDY